MNVKTFYRLYYRHRINKASIILKIYLFLVLPLKYFINYFYIKKKINLDKFSKENPKLFEKNLNYLFEYFNSDKGEYSVNQYSQPSKKENIRLPAHGYSTYYENFFFAIKKEKLDILELGSFYGNASAALYFYFKNSNIYGGDINPDMFRYSSNRVKNFFIDTESKDKIRDIVLNNDQKFDIIIEDASHRLKDQIISLFMLFPKIKKGGIFFVEELDFPEKRIDMRQGQSHPDLKTILNLINLKKDFNSEYITESEKFFFLDNFKSIEIIKGNINELAIIKKK